MNIFEFLEEYTGQSYSDLQEESALEQPEEINTYSNEAYEQGIISAPEESPEVSQSTEEPPLQGNFLEGVTDE